MFEFKEIAGKSGQSIRVEGFVRAVRVQSKMAFVVLESGASAVQCVCFGPAKEQAKALMQRAYAAVEGVVVESPQAPGGFEVKAEAVELVSAAPAASWPVGPESEIGKKLDWPVARFRERKEQLILSASSELEFQMVSFLRSKGFVGVHTPKIVGTPSESGSEVFKLKYFGEEAYLAMSPQLAKNPEYTECVLFS